MGLNNDYLQRSFKNLEGYTPVISMKGPTISADGRFLSDYSPEIGALAVASKEIHLGVVQIHGLHDYYNRFGLEGLQTVADRLMKFFQDCSSVGVSYPLLSGQSIVHGRYRGILFESDVPEIQEEVMQGLRVIIAEFPRKPLLSISLSFDLATIPVQHGQDSASIISSLEEQLVRAAACVGSQGVFVYCPP